MILSGMIFLRSPSGRRFRDWTELKLPMFNRIWIKILVARYCQTLGTLLKSGVDLKTSLEIAKHVVVNRRFISALDKMIIDVNNKGVPLSAAMGKLEYFPEYVRHVVAIGEEPHGWMNCWKRSPIACRKKSSPSSRPSPHSFSRH